jgi:hypothetical protein
MILLSIAILLLIRPLNVIDFLFCTDIKLKLKLSHYTPWKRLGERNYSSYSFSASALDKVEFSASRPGRALPPGMGISVSIVQEAGWAPELVWTQMLEEKFFRLCRPSKLDALSSSL